MGADQPGLPHPGRPHQTQSDEDELLALSLAYANAADARDGERFAQLFIDDGELVVPSEAMKSTETLTRKGRQALRRIPEALRRYDRTHHQVDFGEFLIHGDRATGHVSSVAHHIESRVHGSLDTVWNIDYRDTYQRLDGSWLFVRRELRVAAIEVHPIFEENLSGHD